jgi:hypothetical protein
MVGARTDREVDAFVSGLDARVPEELWLALEAA